MNTKHENNPFQINNAPLDESSDVHARKKPRSMLSNANLCVNKTTGSSLFFASTTSNVSTSERSLTQSTSSVKPLLTRKEKNRIAAHLSRQRKKDQQKKLDAPISDLQQERVVLPQQEADTSESSTLEQPGLDMVQQLPILQQQITSLYASLRGLTQDFRFFVQQRAEIRDELLALREENASLREKNVGLCEEVRQLNIQLAFMPPLTKEQYEEAEKGILAQFSMN